MNKKIIPKIAWLTTNRTCNNKCNWCYTYEYSTKNLEMEMNKFYSIVDELKRNNINKIILIGGEPTVNKNIFDIIKYISNKKIKVSMASNGRMFSNEKFTKKCAECGLKYVNVSLKALSEKDYINNTKCEGFEETFMGYNNLKKNNIECIMSYVITKNDYNEFVKLKKILINKNVDFIYFLLYKPAIDSESDMNQPSMQELALACENIYNIFKDSNIKIKFEMSIPLCLFDDKIIDEFINDKIITTCCHISTGNGIIFDTDFNILPCNHFVNHQLNKDEINSNELIEFWNSEECIKFRKVLKTYPSLKCTTCSKWNICGGGCKLRWITSNPDDIIK